MTSSHNDIVNLIKSQMRYGKVYVSIIREIGLNMWIQFYRFEASQIIFTDLALFDTAKSWNFEEVFNPNDLHEVRKFELNETPSKDTYRIDLELSIDSNVVKFEFIIKEIYSRVCEKPINI